MRLAVCLSGQPRCLDECVLGILKLFSKCEVDFYIHSWTEINSYRGGLDCRYLPGKLESWYRENYKPKVVLVQDPKELEDMYQVQYPGLSTKHSGMFFQIYSAAKVLQQIDFSEHYDLVVLTRTDLYQYGGEFDTKKVLEIFRTVQVPQRVVIALERQHTWMTGNYVGLRIPDVFLGMSSEAAQIVRDNLFLIWNKNTIDQILSKSEEGWEYFEQILPRVCHHCSLEVVPADLFLKARYRYPLPKEFTGIVEGNQEEAQTEDFLRFCYRYQAHTEKFRNAGYDPVVLQQRYRNFKAKEGDEKGTGSC